MGARRVGMHGVLIDRAGTAVTDAGVPVIATLRALPDLCGRLSRAAR
jgi:hypothetical protein